MINQLLNFFLCLIFYAIACGVPVAYIFLLVFTLALKERDAKLKIREIAQCLFKKLF